MLRKAQKYIKMLHGIIGVNKLKITIFTSPEIKFHFAFYPKLSSILCYIFGIFNMYSMYLLDLDNFSFLPSYLSHC